VPISATANLNKLRDRLLAIRNESGSFSSSGSERIALNTGNNVSVNKDEAKAAKPLKPAWRISAQASEQDASPAPAAPSLSSKPQAVSRKLASSADLPPRSPPRRSSSRLNPQPSPRTPSRTPPANSSYNTPRRSVGGGGDGNGNGSWDEQLGVLDRLSRQLSITASHLSEDSPEKQRAMAQQRPRRSSVADWQKYQELAAQLEQARSQLENLDSSDDEEVSFTTLMEDN
jgi:hypothetical protein